METGIYGEPDFYQVLAWTTVFKFYNMSIDIIYIIFAHEDIEN